MRIAVVHQDRPAEKIWCLRQERPRSFYVSENFRGAFWGNREISDICGILGHRNQGIVNAIHHGQNLVGDLLGARCVCTFHSSTYLCPDKRWEKVQTSVTDKSRHAHRFILGETNHLTDRRDSSQTNGTRQGDTNWSPDGANDLFFKLSFCSYCLFLWVFILFLNFF